MTKPGQIVAAAVVALIGLTVALRSEYDCGKADQYATDVAAKRDVDDRLAKIGICEWPKAFARAHPDYGATIVTLTQNDVEAYVTIKPNQVLSEESK